MENPKDGQQPLQEAGQKAPSKRLTHREKRQLWKAAKKAKRDELKEFYRYAPALKRWWMLYLWKPTAVILALLVFFGALAEPVQKLIDAAVMINYHETKDLPLSEADIPKLYEQSPLDEEGAKRIDAIPAVGEDETWAIYVYMVGSNLEDCDENDLSYVTSMLSRDIRDENASSKSSRRSENLSRFNSELKENGLDLPDFFFYPEKPVASSEVVTNDVIVADSLGAASADIAEMTAGTWSDNISIVIQTGGATRWSNQMVNPNRTQRFLYHGGDFREVSNLSLEPPSQPDTLAEFLRFCKKEYPADHTMLVFWNHGGGPFGYGNDSIFSGAFSLADIRQALSDVYTPNRNKPAFDIIGFDACLMSCLEVTHTLDGFARYYCLSEEVEPGDGWDYTPFLQAMSDDPTMSPAKVARHVADSYTDYYMRENINQDLIKMDVTFSVIDAPKAAELYDAYAALCQAQLLDAYSDMGVLAEIGRCASRATRYAGSNSNVFNTIDLGNYMDYLSDSYPDECARVKELIGEAVLYHRENGGLSDSTGIAVYVPGDIREVYGLLYYLEYIYDICDDPAVAALYYYKQAGCLSDELKESLAKITDEEPQVLNVSAFREFMRGEPAFDGNGFLLPVTEQLQDLIVSYEMELGRYDENSNAITYYGREKCLTLDGEGHLASDFDGKWICLDGQPLDVEIVSSTASATDYRAHVLYNGEEAWLELRCDRDTDGMSITGVRKVPTGLEEDVNYLANTRSNEEVAFGARITPVYRQTDFASNSTSFVNGTAVPFSAKTRLERSPLPDGYYLGSAVISDSRGDSYYSAVVGASVKSGRLAGWQLDSRFYGRNYD